VAVQTFKNLEVVCKKGNIPDVPFLHIKEKILGKNFELSISFIGPKLAQELNIKYRNKDYIPNILTFPLDDKTGEMYICKSIARKQYKDFYDNYNKYLTLLVVHGCLHLKGDEHGSIMETKEHELTEKFAK
jgi:probable rRNA maturation factor